MTFGCAGSLLLHGLFFFFFSSCSKRRPLSSCGLLTGEAALWGALTLGLWVSVAGAPGLQSCGAWA